MGIPVVTTDYPAACELISNGQQGFIVPRNNPAAMAERIQLLLDDHALCSRMGADGRKKVRGTFQSRCNDAGTGCRISDRNEKTGAE